MEHKQARKIIALAADERYSDKVLTLIKSICSYNSDITFYLFNPDFSKEWFDHLNGFLEKINCSIIDVKIKSEKIKEYRTYQHISSDATYYRYFIADVIPDDKVLYLDCDIVVNGKLDELFAIDVSEFALAACLDDIAENFFQKTNNFNAGVLLINNKLWRENDISAKAIVVSDLYNGDLPDGDQTVLNILFKGHWLRLGHSANYLVGGEYLYRKNGIDKDVMRDNDQLPLILHFNTKYKPWLPYYDLPFREYYWFYNQLTWDRIIERHKNENA